MGITYIMLGRIYRLSGNGKFYIGSTCETLARRLVRHKSRSNDPDRKNASLYKYFRDLGWENAIIELIEEVEVDTRRQLLERECCHIKEAMKDDNCLNINRSITTVEEKKELSKVISKKIRTENPDRERERLSEWRKNNPEKYRAQLERVKEKQRNKVVENGVKNIWRQNHPEKYAEEKKRTAEKNKERALAQKDFFLKL